MKVKGFEDKIYRLNPNSINFNVGLLAKLKEGKTVELVKEDSSDLRIKGIVELGKPRKKGDN